MPTVLTVKRRVDGVFATKRLFFMRLLYGRTLNQNVESTESANSAIIEDNFFYSIIAMLLKLVRCLDNLGIHFNDTAIESKNVLQSPRCRQIDTTAFFSMYEM